MGVGELLVALVICVAALVGSSAPIAAFGRTREPRFLLVAGAYLALLAFGAVAAVGEANPSAAGYTHVPAVPLELVAAAAALLLVSALLPRNS